MARRAVTLGACGSAKEVHLLSRREEIQALKDAVVKFEGFRATLLANMAVCVLLCT